MTGVTTVSLMGVGGQGILLAAASSPRRPPPRACA